MATCKIKFDDDRTKFFVGEVVRGSIDLILDHPKKFRGMYYVVHGAVKVHWTEQRTAVKTLTHIVHFEGKENFLKSKKYLFGYEGATPPITMSQGTHSFRFEFHLPKALPATIRVNNGQIHYYIEAVLDIPWRQDKEFKLPFKLQRNDDLNLYPDLKNTFIVNDTRTTGLWFLKSDPLTMTVSVPQTGFAPHEMIPVLITLNNRTKIEVIETTIVLRRVIKYYCSSPYQKKKTEVLILSHNRGSGVRKLTTVSYETFLEIIGIEFNSNSQFSKTLQVTYELMVEARLSGIWKNLKSVIPITIGTIPIRPSADSSELQGSPFRYSNFLLESFSEDDSTREPLGNPPSYDEVIRMDQTEEPRTVTENN